jgi:hypothetical protein
MVLPIMTRVSVESGARPEARSHPERTALARISIASLAIPLLSIGAAVGTPVSTLSPALAQSTNVQPPAAPANGIMGFVVHHFVPSVIQGKDACPEGLAVTPKDRFLAKLPQEERERLQKDEHRAEFMRRLRADITGSGGTNICSHYAMFPERSTIYPVQSKHAWGLNLDGDEGNGSSNPDGCAHENFSSPDGENGIDNQAYRALGCTASWRGTDGVAGDIVRGFSQFVASGEWTQVLLLRGVDSLVNDSEVEVIYGNTPDRPVVDSAGKFIHNATFTISDKAPRYRNALRGRIVNGVLTTDPNDIKLTQTWGQRARIDLRGARGHWDLRRARLRLTFQPDGTLKGLVGGYEPIGDQLLSASLGDYGSAMNGGIDCAAQYNTLRKLADGLRDPKTGECTGVSSALDLRAVPAFVNDTPSAPAIASK